MGGELSQRYRDYMESPQWQRFRDSMLERADNMCEGCGKRDETLQVHHITYVRLGHENPDDVQVLCLSCHDAVTAMDRAERARGIRHTTKPVIHRVMGLVCIGYRDGS